MPDAAPTGIRGRLRAARREVTAIWFATRDPRTPWFARAVALLVVAYALSPLDLVPDFIPVLGLLDDALLIPAGLLLARRLIPADVMQEALMRASLEGARGASRAGLILTLAAWVAAAAVVAWVCWVFAGPGKVFG